MPSTACTTPRDVSKRTCRSCTSSKGTLAPDCDRLSVKVSTRQLTLERRDYSFLSPVAGYTGSAVHRPPDLWVIDARPLGTPAPRGPAPGVRSSLHDLP